MRLADDVIIPLNLTRYAETIELHFKLLDATYEEQLSNHSISLSEYYFIKNH